MLPKRDVPSWRPAAAAFALLLVTACAGSPTPFSERFTLPDDGLAYSNDLVWDYAYDESGSWVGKRRDPPPEYSHRCFAQVRTARLFFQYARFDASRPKLDRAGYRALVELIDGGNPRRRGAATHPIVVPGFANLHQFSVVHDDLLKEVGGGIWRSYVQRGNWRMVIPFSRRNQARTAAKLVESIDENRPAILRLVRFPKITINHTVIAYGYEEEPNATTFHVYDPNLPTAPRSLVFDRDTRTFSFVQTDYFPGGRVDVYEIFDDVFF